jgi:hypothetical protein
MGRNSSLVIFTYRVWGNQSKNDLKPGFGLRQQTRQLNYLAESARKSHLHDTSQ